MPLNVRSRFLLLLACGLLNSDVAGAEIRPANASAPKAAAQTRVGQGPFADIGQPVPVAPQPSPQPDTARKR